MKIQNIKIMTTIIQAYSGIAISLIGILHTNSVLFLSGALITGSGFMLTCNLCESINKSLLKVILALEKEEDSLDYDKSNKNRELKLTKGK